MKDMISHLLCTLILSVSSFSVAASTETPDGLNASEWSGIQATIEADRYRARLLKSETGETSRIEMDNPAHGLRAVFDRSGLSLAPSSASSTQWTLDMHLVAWGRKGQAAEFEVLKPTAPVLTDERVEYRYATLTEWFVNDKRGLEQGFTITQRPEGENSQPIRLELALGGALSAELLEQHDGLVLRDSEGVERVRYTGLLAWDASGRDLAVTLARTAQGLALEVADTNAHYPVTIDPTFTEVAKLSGDGVGEICQSCQFGYSVSVAGDTALIGAYQDDDKGEDSGSAYVFIRSGGSWSQQQKLTASDGASFDLFGTSVSVSGDTALIGAYRDDDKGSDSGSAYVFIRSGGSWSQQGKLTASDGASSARFGYSVSVSGDTALIGAYGNYDKGTQSGSAYVFIRSGGSWSQQGKLTANDSVSFDYFGWAVSVSGDTALIGAYGDDDKGGDSGSAYVFIRSGGSWTQQGKLTANDGANLDEFGRSVSVSGDTALIGAYRDDDKGINSGSAYVFIRSGGSWTQQGKLTASDGTIGDEFGISVSVSGDTALIGAYQDDDKGSNSGSAYVFSRSGGSWTQQGKLTANDGASFDYFGGSVAVAGDAVLIGAYQDDDKGGDAGSAYVFIHSGSSWSQETKLLPDGSPALDYFGYSVSVSGDTALIGAFQDDDKGSLSGSAYVFIRSGGSWSQQGKLTAGDGASFDRFGISVSVSGDTALIGAYIDDDKGSQSGSAYVFVRSSGSWNQQQKLTASDGASLDHFGYSVSVSGDTALIGAWMDDDKGSNSGSAYVFIRSGGSWTQQQKLTASDGASDDRFGISVSVSGDTALIGAFRDDDKGGDAGSAYVFIRSGGSWTQQGKLTANDGASFDYFGWSVSVSGDTALIGAFLDDDKGSQSGSAYVFIRSSGSWNQQQKLTASDGAIGDEFGISVSVAGDIALIGAHYDDDKGSNSGSAYVFIRSGGSWTQQGKLTASDGASNDYFGRSVSVSGATVLIGAFLDDDPETDTGSTYIFETSITNSPPEAINDSTNVDEDDTVVIDVAFNDNDPDGNLDPASANTSCGTCSNPSDGALANNGNGTFDYTPDANFNGLDTFEYEICDDEALCDNATVAITVDPINDLPQVNAGADSSSDEGTAWSQAGSFSDPDTGDSHSATVDYGDGGGAQVLTLSGTSFNLNHVFADNGSYTVTVEVTDSSSTPVADTVIVTVANVTPTVDAGADDSINEGSTFTSSGSFSDPGTVDTHTATVDYGDGSGPQPLILSSTSFNLSHVYSNNGSYTVTVVVTDNDGGSGSDTATVTVANVAPAVDAGPDATIDEDSTFISAGSFSDSGINDTHTATVDYGDGSGVQALTLAENTFTLSHTYADDGIFTVTVAVTDNDGGSGSDTATVTVANVAPTVDAGADDSIDEGSIFASSGSFTDPGDDSWTASVDYGDGTGTQSLALSGKSFSLGHTYTDDDVFTVTVCVTDDDDTGCDSALVTVANVTPTVDAGPDLVITDGVYASSGSFADPGADVWTATVDYGDGSGVQVLALDQNLKTFSLAYSYADKGVYTVNVCVSDDEGATSCDSAMVTNNLTTAVTVVDVSVQYSDFVELQASLSDSLSRPVANAALQFDVFGICSGSATTNTSGLAVFTCGTVNEAESVHTIDVVYAGEVGRYLLSSNSSGQLAVTSEDASVDYDSDNSVSVRVAEDGGDSGPFMIVIDVTEAVPNAAGTDSSSASLAFAGDISLADVSVNLTAVGPGPSYVGVCTPAVTGSGYSAILTLTCGFNGVEVNTYAVEVTVDGGYYSGSFEDVLTVYDPSLGFTTGGGFLYWPNAAYANDGLAEAGDKTNFGFSIKYNKKGHQVQGSLLVIRHLADGSKFRLKSNALEGLAVDEFDENGETYGLASFSGKATYLEPGWPDPIGNYTFIALVEDRNEPGTGIDRIWLQVKDKDGNLMFDLSLDEPASANTEEIDGGNIQVPHGASGGTDGGGGKKK